MPSLGGDITEWKVSVMSTPNVSLSSPKARIAMTGVYVRPQIKDDQIIMPPTGAVQAVPILLEAMQRADVYEAGFRVVTDSIVAHPPEPVSLAVASGQQTEPPDEPDDET
jgi:hypothetical protein